MVQSSSKILGENINFASLLKKFTFVFLTWTCLAYNDVGIFTKSLEHKYEQDKIFNICFYRLLAKYEQLRELRDNRFRDKLPDRNLHKNRRSVSNNIPTYSEVRSKASNNFDVYMKGYKDRYMKKKGLSKLDCYYENKVFAKINHIRDIAEKMHNDKKRWKKFFFKKYGVGLIIFSLIPALGLIFYIFFGVEDKAGYYGLCPNGHFENGTGKHKNGETQYTDCTTRWMYEDDGLYDIIHYANFILSFIMFIIVISVISYILIKFIKYERIKAGKGKIREKVY